MHAFTSRRSITLGALTGVALGTFGWAKEPQARRREKPQPHMTDALNGLRSAKKALELGTSDHGGHRLKALDHVNKAIGEVEAAIQYADEHSK